MDIAKAFDEALISFCQALVSEQSGDQKSRALIGNISIRSLFNKDSAVSAGLSVYEVGFQESEGIVAYLITCAMVQQKIHSQLGFFDRRKRENIDKVLRYDLLANAAISKFGMPDVIKFAAFTENFMKRTIGT